MWHCSHSKRYLVTETDYRGYPEMIYSCQYCGAIIAVPAEHAEEVPEPRHTTESCSVLSTVPVSN